MMESVIKDYVMNYLSVWLPYRYVYLIIMLSLCLSLLLCLPYRYGFIPGRLCPIQLLHALDYITKHLGNGYTVDMIYLDFQKTLFLINT